MALGNVGNKLREVVGIAVLSWTHCCMPPSTLGAVVRDTTIAGSSPFVGPRAHDLVLTRPIGKAVYGQDACPLPPPGCTRVRDRKSVFTGTTIPMTKTIIIIASATPLSSRTQPPSCSGCLAWQGPAFVATSRRRLKVQGHKTPRSPEDARVYLHQFPSLRMSPCRGRTPLM